MEHLYAPWRTDYVTGERIDGCVFCHISKHPNLDQKHHVIYRDEVCFGVMNKFPYTPGHFMFIPHTHTDAIEELSGKDWVHITALVQKGVDLLKNGFGASGVNIGMNLGECGGAGIAEHVHMHLVPRFPRDTNFITAIGDNRIYSTDFERIYKKINELGKEYFK